MARLFEAVFLSGLGVCIYGCAGAGMMARPDDRHRADWRPRSGWESSLAATGFESSSGPPWFCLLDGRFQLPAFE